MSPSETAMGRILPARRSLRPLRAVGKWNLWLAEAGGTEGQILMGSCLTVYL